MPTFNIFVTTAKKDVPADFVLKASKFIAAQLGKPESYVTVRLVPDQIMSHGGSTDPCASVQVFSIGAIGGEKNKNHSQAIGKFINSELGIPIDRFYVTFIDVARSDCGYNGSTFA
ncbi:macrophage migration inhibitory factor homolog [Mya arenaria]|uniref:macrophage migration inhibitory factor homolog n=1 Tax=Mya arenaria TaxID=6604 RepID=UPI0022E535EC|nr:macrophage migration inhibitory factor homolog [Mya arenaria]